MSYGLVAIVGLLVVAFALLAAAATHAPQCDAGAPAWKSFHFRYAVYALVFVSFDMEMIFMYPWAVVFADLGVAAFLDMLVFIALLGAGIAYAWGMGGFEWE